jgi:glucose-1-phosphate thymidylyltransferase
MQFNVVIPAAGAATRLRPLTNNCSKAMVRIHGKPAIGYILEYLYSKGANDIVIVDGIFDDIRRYCDSKFPNVQFIKQGELKGPHDAIRKGINIIGPRDIPLVVWLGDTLVFDEDLPLGEDFLLTKEVDNHAEWCMWDGDQFYDKPVTPIENARALVGVYSFSSKMKARDAFCDTEGEYDISAALEAYMYDFKSVLVKEWYDIGTISSYQKTCAALLTKKARVFNSFQYIEDLNAIQKRGSCITNEINWYKSLNSEQNFFVPRIYNTNEDVLVLSYESGTLLTDLLLYEDINEATFSYILDKLFRVMTKYFWKWTPLDLSASVEYMWRTKTLDRIGLLSSDKHRAFADFVCEVVDDNHLNDYISVSCIHGDLHGGNILYDVYNDSFKLIDPRGLFGNDKTSSESISQFRQTSGDLYYDLAKLSHDFYHGYGAIVNETKYPSFVKKVFVDMLHKYGYNSKKVNDLGAILLMSCIPLHYESKIRQQVMKNTVEDYINENIDR